MLPTFLVIGAMKTGTTSLHRYLADHPQVFMSRPKELNFFTEEHNWSQGRAWYEEQFSPANRALAAGESSTNYSKHPEFAGVPARIASVIPEVRLIYVVREPVERMRSQYLHRYARGRERAPIEEALLHNPTYVNTSRYAMQIERFLEHFGRDRLLVLRAERLREERKGTLRRVFDFVGVDSDFEPPSVDQEFYRTAERQEDRPLASTLRHLPALGSIAAAAPRSWKLAGRRLLKHELDPGRARISEDVRRHLESLLRDDVRRLRDYLDEDFDGWGIG